VDGCRAHLNAPAFSVVSNEASARACIENEAIAGLYVTPPSHQDCSVVPFRHSASAPYMYASPPRLSSQPFAPRVPPFIAETLIWEC